MTVVALSMSGCALFDHSDDDAVFVSDVAMRLFDGFELGADTAAVRQIFGEPDAILEGDFEGFAYTYDSGLEVWFLGDADFRAVLVQAEPPYTVITTEGIGIGATSAKVASVFGTPHETEVRAQWGVCTGDIFIGREGAALCFGYDSTGNVNRVKYLLPVVDE